jgi:acetoin utilization deacetylase AcuC-like enzyme
MTQVPTVWDARYCCEAAPLTSTTKQARVVAAAKAEGLLKFYPAEPRLSLGIYPTIKFTHETKYVDAVMTGEPRSLAESQGFEWSPEFAESVAQIWHGHQHAIALTRQHPLVLHPVSGAHHAHRGKGGGFCTFNYLVGGAAKFLMTDGRCLIIDLDAHYGDGTASMIENDDRFALFDIHGGARSGLADSLIHTLALEAQNATLYLRYLKEFLPTFIDTFKPTLVQYLAGADPYAKDPVGGIKGVGASTLRARDAFVIDEVRRRGIPTVVTLAGGYVPGVTEEIHLNTIREMARSLEGK